MSSPENSSGIPAAEELDDGLHCASDHPDFMFEPGELQEVHHKKLLNAANGLDPVEASKDPAHRTVDAD